MKYYSEILEIFKKITILLKYDSVKRLTTV